MSDFRRRLWLNIMEDLGPPEGCIVPGWLLFVYLLLFPLQGLRIILDRSTGHDFSRLVWRIHGIEFSDQFFVRLALSTGKLYRFSRVGSVVIIEEVTQ